MPTSRQVKCITKSDRTNRHERISHIGGDWGTNNTRIKVTEEKAIQDIENGTYSYHVKVLYNDVQVIIKSHLGRKYLKTVSDSTTVDNLLNLPEC